MAQILQFDPELIRKYDKSGPRYTSYPTAPQFTDAFDDKALRRSIERSNHEMIPKPLSLYVHIPFCDTICYYCACNKIITKNHSLSDEYLDLLETELHLLSPLFDPDREIEQLHLGGGTPTFLSDEEMIHLMSLIEDNYQVSEDCEMSIEIDPRKVTDDSLRTLTNIGFNRMSLGVQDFDERVQHAVNRVQSFEMVRDRLHTARDLGVQSVNMDLIYGLPLQTPETFGQTLDKVIELRPDRLSIFNYAHLPERFKPQRRINAEELPTPAQKLEIFQLTMERLQQAGYVYIGMDHFALESDSMVKAQQEGTLQRNFQGYSTHKDADLVAIGVSSIASIGDSYSQNSSDMETYRELLQSGQLPVVRGIQLSDEDRLRKQVISQLICHFHLDFADIELSWDIRFSEHFARELEQLQEMVADDLVEIDESSIRVKPRGRLLIRNVCMVFDEYLRHNVVQFSKVI
jgi:oxygen-independent coproporphyrinogen-3 oxidase